MVVYLLNTLARCKCDWVIVATTSRYEGLVRAALLREASEGWLRVMGSEELNVEGRLCVEVIVVDEMVGSVGALREVCKLESMSRCRDVVVLSGECQLGRGSLLRLIEAHRERSPDCTMALRRLDPKEKVGAEDAEIVLLSGQSYVLDKVSRLELEDEADDGDGKLRVPRALLWRDRRLVAAADLVDIHAYVFNLSALNGALGDENASIKADLIPMLARRYTRAKARTIVTQQTYADMMTPTDASLDEPRGVIAVVVRGQSVTPDPSDDDPLGSDFVHRVRSVQAYSMLCRHVVSRALHSSCPPKLMPRGTISKRDGALVGPETKISEKAQLKHSTVGSRVVIGARCKVNNSVVFDDATLEDGAVVQNSVICAGATVGLKSNLNEVHVGPRALVAPNAVLKQEALTADSNTSDATPVHE